MTSKRIEIVLEPLERGTGIKVGQIFDVAEEELSGRFKGVSIWLANGKLFKLSTCEYRYLKGKKDVV